METSLLKTIGQIAAIGGISLGIILLLFKDAVQKQIIPLFKEKEIGTKILRSLRTGVWTIAVAGVAAWVFSSFGGTDGIKVTNNEFSGDMIFVSDASILSQLKLEGVENADDPEITNQLAKASKLVKTNNFEEAIPIYQQVASKANISSVFNNLGLLYAATNDKENAKANYAKSVQLDPTEQAAQYNLGLLEESLGNLNEALERFNKAPDISDAGPLSRKIRKNLKAGTFENEPNDKKLQANILPLRKMIAASVGKAGDKDVFLITTPPTYRDKVEVRVFPSSTLVPGITISNELNRDITAAEADNYDEEVKIRFVADAGKEYYIKVWARWNSTGAYQLEAIPLNQYDAFEPNDDEQSFSKIGLNKKIAANIMDPGDKDFYQVNIKTPGTYIVELFNKSKLVPYIEVLDGKMAKIDFTEGSRESESISLEFMVETPDNYHIQIGGRWSTDGSHEFLVRKKTDS